MVSTVVELEANEPIKTKVDVLDQEEDFFSGRLFFSQNTRRVLDRLRLGGKPEVQMEENVVMEGMVIEGPRYVSVDGLIFKDNGENVVWLNGQAVTSKSPFEGEGFVAFPKDANEMVGVPISSVDSFHTFYLKSGQTLDFVKGEVRDTYTIDPHMLSSARREPPPKLEQGSMGEEQAGGSMAPPNEIQRSELIRQIMGNVDALRKK